jgi:lipid-binding SYLF domain-containing protein
MPTPSRTFGLTYAILALSVFLLPTGCHEKQTSTSSAESKDQAKLAKDQGKMENLHRDADTALNDFRTADPSLDTLLQRAAGYAVFPSIGKGGFVVGGAHGKGLVYENGRPIGEAELNQASVGFLAGGQTFRELIVFETPDALSRFRQGQMSLGADVNAVILKTGAAGQANFKNGVAVLIKPIGGAMIDASVAGQKFTFKSMRM